MRISSASSSALAMRISVVATGLAFAMTSESRSGERET
jgi:hypothetical protein